jgi:serine/threonine protein phosphatase 1
MFDVLQNLLKNIAFDPTKDRLISVGDLVDRGRDSQKCLELLKEPWFHAVIANHEQMMLEAFDGGWLGQFWLQNGGFWAYTALELYKQRQRTVTNELDRPRDPTAEEQRLFELLPLVRELPYLITIERPDGKKFHVIHAELPSLDLTDEILADPARVEKLVMIDAKEGPVFTWGRYLFGKFYALNLANVDKIKRTIAYQLRQDEHLWRPGLSHVISGHTILQRPLTLLGRTNIDTGAFMIPEGRSWPALTCVELGSWSFYQATEDSFRTVEPLVVNKADIDELRNSPVPVSSLNGVSTTPLIDALNNQGQP